MSDPELIEAMRTGVTDWAREQGYDPDHFYIATAQTAGRGGEAIDPETCPPAKVLRRHGMTLMRRTSNPQETHQDA